MGTLLLFQIEWNSRFGVGFSRADVVSLAGDHSDEDIAGIGKILYSKTILTVVTVGLSSSGKKLETCMIACCDQPNCSGMSASLRSELLCQEVPRWKDW